MMDTEIRSEEVGWFHCFCFCFVRRWWVDSEVLLKPQRCNMFCQRHGCVVFLDMPGFHPTTFRGTGACLPENPS